MKSKKTTAFEIIIIVLAVAVVFYALFGHSTSIDTAKVILPTPIASGADPGSDGTVNSGIVVAEVTPETVQAVIGTLSRAESYSRTVTVEDFWNSGSSSTELSVWVEGESTRIRLDSGRDIKNILITGGKLYIWYDNAKGLYTGSTDGTGSPEADIWLRSLTYEDLLSLPVSAITDAGYTAYAGESCIYAEYLTENFGYRNIVYVSVNTGLLMGAESFDGETLVYRMTSGAPDISAPDASHFSPPGDSAQSE